MTITTRLVEYIKCFFCNDEQEHNSSDGRRFVKIPRGREDEQIDVCEECFDVLKTFFETKDKE